jgi:hypothetical protein
MEISVTYNITYRYLSVIYNITGGLRGRVVMTSASYHKAGLSPPARVGSNPGRTDVTVLESLSVNLLAEGRWSLPKYIVYYNVSGFSLPSIKTVCHHIHVTEKLSSMAKNHKEINK